MDYITHTDLHYVSDLPVCTFFATGTILGGLYILARLNMWPGFGKSFQRNDKILTLLWSPVYIITCGGFVHDSQIIAKFSS